MTEEGNVGKVERGPLRICGVRMRQRSRRVVLGALPTYMGRTSNDTLQRINHRWGNLGHTMQKARFGMFVPLQMLYSPARLSVRPTPEEKKSPLRLPLLFPIHFAQVN